MVINVSLKKKHFSKDQTDVYIFIQIAIKDIYSCPFRISVCIAPGLRQRAAVHCSHTFFSPDDDLTDLAYDG